VIKFILKNYTKDHDGVFSKNFKIKNQLDEIILRKKTASINYNDYFGEISKHHSIEVMNKEVLIFLKYNEILFHPELKLFFGKKDSFLSKLDSKLSGLGFFRSHLARQVLIKIKK